MNNNVIIAMLVTICIITVTGIIAVSMNGSC